MARSDMMNGFMKGRVAEIYIWNAPPTDFQIRVAATSGFDQKAPGGILTALFGCEEGDGNYVKDGISARSLSVSFHCGLANRKTDQPTCARSLPCGAQYASRAAMRAVSMRPACENGSEISTAVRGSC